MESDIWALGKWKGGAKVGKRQTSDMIGLDVTSNSSDGSDCLSLSVLSRRPRLASACVGPFVSCQAVPPSLLTPTSSSYHLISPQRYKPVSESTIVNGRRRITKLPNRDETHSIPPPA